jgi:pyrroline-5-carboxylate reductase
MKKRILFLGYGKMGEAIAQNFIKNNVIRGDILAIDPISKEADILSIKDIKEGYSADVVIFAIKPQGCEEAIKEFMNSGSYNESTIFISILAGKDVDFFENIIGKDKKIIRLMPNLPILIGEGMCGYFANGNIQNGEEKEIINLFGKNIKVDNEDLINQVTAISGSGPAYLFLFAKTMVEAGKEIGLSNKESQELVKQTLLGASKMLLNEDNIDQLIDNVTSKGGTTKAALDVFRKEGSLQNITSEAVKAALKRSREL